MHIAIKHLQEGRSYKIDETYSTDSSYSKLVDAKLISPIVLKGSYLWINEELIVKITTEYEISALCDMCGEPTEAHCECTLNEELDYSSEYYDEAEDAFNIEPLIRECIVLSMARTVRCNKNCKGICPKCGQNLNEKECECEKTDQDESNPFGILKQLINTGGANNGSTEK